MLVPADDPDLAEFLRLKSCPNCDYCLETLPLAGKCPECGQFYDQQVAVLTGKGRGLHSYYVGGTWRGIGLLLAVIAFLLWMLTTGHRYFYLTTLHIVMWLIILFPFALIQMYAWISSPRAPQMQVWISRQGIVQVLSTAEGRQAQRVSRLAQSFASPVVTSLMVTQIRMPGPIAAGIILFYWLLCIPAVRRYWKSRGRRIANEYEGSYWPWSRIDRFEARPLANDRCRLRARVTMFWWKIKTREDWVVDIEFPCPPEIAVKLQWLPRHYR
jgi:hypothetical protein